MEDAGTLRYLMIDMNPKTALGFWHFTFSQLLHIEHSDADITKALLRPPMSGTPTDGLKFIGVKGVSMIIAKIKELVSYFLLHVFHN